MTKERAIKALEQEPCEDAISRQAVLVSIKNLYPDMPIVDIWGARRKWLEKYAPYFECENVVEQLPSVKPQEPNTGYWIDLKEDNEMSDDDMWRYSCNMCHGQNFRKTLFCPNCGCAMVEPQESEEV